MPEWQINTVGRPKLDLCEWLLVFVERRFLMAKRRYPPKIEGKEKILKNIYMYIIIKLFNSRFYRRVTTELVRRHFGCEGGVVRTAAAHLSNAQEDN